MPRGLQHGCGQGRVSAAVLHFLPRLPACRRQLPASWGTLPAQSRDVCHLPTDCAARTYLTCILTIGLEQARASLQALRGAGVAVLRFDAAADDDDDDDDDEDDDGGDGGDDVALPYPLDSLAGHTSLVDIELCARGAVGDWGHLFHLTQLEQLRLDDLPASFHAQGGQQMSRLARLQGLQLGGCSCRELPGLSALTALTSLSIQGNEPLADGWQHLRPLQQLLEVSVRSCWLAEVPEALSSLTRLTFLSLADNPDIEGGWQHLQPLQRLAVLHLSWTGLLELPEALSSLTALTAIFLAGNKDMDGSSDSWQHLRPLAKTLRELNMCDCVAVVPLELSCLTALTSLDLSNSIVEPYCWERLSPLQALQQLCIDGRALHELPHEFSALTALTSLRVGGPKVLQGGWRHLRPLRQLRQLCIHDDYISEGLAGLPAELSELRAHNTLLEFAAHSDV